MMEEYRKIPLTRGQVAIVDAADYEWLMQWKWHAMPHHVRGFYAARNSFYIKGLKRHHIWMHRAILGLEPDDPRQTDHRNGDKLDNRRLNLRITNSSQNMMNRSLFRNNSTGHKGVYLASRGGREGSKYEVRIGVGGKVLQIGTFATIEEACVARLEASRQYHGEFARSA